MLDNRSPGAPDSRVFPLQLPWSTANEDLVELFETTGQVELAEILFEGTRSKGCGVVQFGQVQEAETAIGESPSWCPIGHSMLTLRSKIPAVHVWWPSSRRPLQRPLAHLHAQCRQGWSNRSCASRGRLICLYLLGLPPKSAPLMCTCAKSMLLFYMLRYIPDVNSTVFPLRAVC